MGKKLKKNSNVTFFAPENSETKPNWKGKVC